MDDLARKQAEFEGLLREAASLLPGYLEAKYGVPKDNNNDGDDVDDGR
jgi:hypothetical protein